MPRPQTGGDTDVGVIAVSARHHRRRRPLPDPVGDFRSRYTRRAALAPSAPRSPILTTGTMRSLA